MIITCYKLFVISNMMNLLLFLLHLASLSWAMSPLEDFFSIILDGLEDAPTVCENEHGDLGNCMTSLECESTSGVEIGKTRCPLHQSIITGICCHHMSCSKSRIPEPSPLMFLLSNGFRNVRDVESQLGLTLPSETNLPLAAKIEECGLFNSDRQTLILGGEKAKSRFPWLMAIWTKKSGSSFHTCGAALINRQYVMTAAHCFQGSFHSPRSFFLLGGSNTNAEDNGSKFFISEIIAHPRFNPDSLEFDIALIRLEKPVIFNNNLFPICLPAPKMPEEFVTDYVGSSGLVAGWGCENEFQCRRSELPTTLREVSIPIVSSDLGMCWFLNDSVNPGEREYIPDRLFVVGGDSSNSRATCSGDSGSPVIRQRPDEERYEAIGIVSWSKGCGREFRPSVWTRVESFVPWIHANLEPIDT